MADEQPKAADGSKAVPPKSSSSSNKTLIIVLAIVAVVVVLPVIVFSIFAFWLSRGDNAANLTENIIESATGSDVEISEDGSSFSIETDEGSISVGEQKLPDNLPSSVVVYDNQKVVSVFTSTETNSTIWTFSSETSDGIDKVNEYIKSKYAEGGWVMTSTSSYNGSVTYSFEKDNLTSVITVMPGENGNMISYYITQDDQSR